ncbi:MAG: hypothetical protein ACRDTX_16985 [Pseudonocardiaceae bacterium]
MGALLVAADAAAQAAVLQRRRPNSRPARRHGSTHRTSAGGTFELSDGITSPPTGCGNQCRKVPDCGR